MRSELPAGWTEETLGDLADNHDKHRVPLSSRERQKRQGPYPYWGANGVLDHVDDYLFEGPHVLIAEDGTVERSDGRAVVHWVDGKFWVNNHAHILTARSGINQRWLYYALRNVRITSYLTGSVQLKLTQTNLRQIPLAKPSEADQDRIASTLGSLDEKIESNRRLAETLEGIAAAVFKSRFIDFVGHSDLVESEIGPVPRGWQVMPVSEAVAINPAVSALKKGATGPHVGMADVPAWGVRPSRFGEREYTGGARFEPGDTLMARITGCIEYGKGAFVDFLDRPGAGSTEFLVLRAQPPLTEEMVFLLSRTARVRDHAIANMSGSSGRQRVPTSAFDHVAIAIPPDAQVIEKEADLFRAVFRQTRALWRMNRTLTKIRDLLLPRLVSGQDLLEAG
ncbi:MAG TPA: restriction endonuclease subunit S [Solirubrobacterales bacterium]|nr:restriction endonuclease subunit S [Solirubrobacterales bacterium]